MAGMRRYRRLLLLVVLPLVALLAGITFYLNGGRYVTTDDAYVGAQKVLITPDISGKIISVAVKEGQTVTAGDVMFQIDPVAVPAGAGAGPRQTRLTPRPATTPSSPMRSCFRRPSKSSTPASR